MSAKRTPPDHEILAMAAELRPMVKTGETVVPFIRRNQQRLRQLIEEESWATFARVMTALGMTYSSGTPWTARYIANEFDRATTPLKRRGRAPTTIAAERTSTAPEPAMSVVHGSQPSAGDRVPQASALAPTTKRKFAPATVRRPEPPEALTQEETTRLEALDERLFGKKS